MERAVWPYVLLKGTDECDPGHHVEPPMRGVRDRDEPVRASTGRPGSPRRIAGTQSSLITEAGHRFRSGFEVTAGLRWDLDHFVREPFEGGYICKGLSAAW